MKKKLPINIKPSLRSLTNHLNLCSICESYIPQEGLVADYDVLSYFDMKEWVLSTVSSRVQVDNNNIKVFNHKYDKDMGCVLYKECKLGEELVIKINTQAYAYAWSNISITIGNKPVTMDRNNKIGVELGNFSKNGIFLYRDNCYIGATENVRNVYPIYLKIKSDANEILAFTSLDGENWKMQNIFQECIDMSESLYMSILVAMDENQWYNWYFTNYILLKCNPDADNVHADHFNALSKNYKYHNLNMFVDCSKIDTEIVFKFFGNITNFIREFIDKNYYIELFLNEKYISGTISNRLGYDRNHSNLVYGYDDYEEFFMIIGLDADGQVLNAEVKYDEFEEAFRRAYGNEELVIVKYNPDGNMYKLNIGLMKKLLEDHLNCYNSTLDCGFLLQPSNELFGIKIYDTYLSDKFFSVFLADRRIAYTLYEHHVIMNDRVDFLCKRGILSTIVADRLKVYTGEMVEISHKLVMLVVRRIVKKEIDDKQSLEGLEIRVHMLLSELKLKEIDLITQLIGWLEKYLDTNTSKSD